jgi:CRISPR-associated protein Cas5t
VEFLALFVSAPIVCFRTPHAREYLETLPCPPPATVYGMLLSFVGEEDRLAHLGAELALAMLSEPALSTVLRTTWQIKKTDLAPGQGQNKGIDYQELLTDVRVAVWLRAGADEASPRPLADRVRAAVDRQEAPRRYGALCLGESTHLIDELRRLRNGDGSRCRLLVAEPRGDLALPIWVDHVGSTGTRWGQYRLAEVGVPEQPPEDAWTTIRPPD